MKTNYRKRIVERMSPILLVLALIMVCAGVTTTRAENPHFTSIDYPGAFLTAANAVNVNGEIVGTYRLVANGPQHGFLLQGDVFTSIDYPGAVHTRALGINDSGDIVGGYTMTGSYEKGFIMKGSVFTTFTAPFLNTWTPWGIDNEGNITGTFKDNGKIKGFFWNGGSTFTAFDAPFVGTSQTQTHGSNERGELVGCYWLGTGASATMHSLRILSDGTYVSEDFPGSISSMHYRISQSSIMVGYYVDTEEMTHAYILKGGAYQSFDFPNAIYTDARGIAEIISVGRQKTRALLIVGSYFDGDNVQRGYLFRLTGVGNVNKY